VTLGGKSARDEASDVDIVFDENDPGHVARLSALCGDQPSLEGSLRSR
jgi:hypothetical protein